MGSNKKILKKKIDTLCAVAACSQFIKHNRKHCRVSNTEEMFGLNSTKIKNTVDTMDLSVHKINK